MFVFDFGGRASSEYPSAVAIGAGSNLGQLHVAKISCQGSLNLIEMLCPFWWLLSSHHRDFGSSKGGYRAGFPLPGSRVPWSLTKLFPWLLTNRGYLECLSTVRPFLVIHSTTGALLCPLSILDYLVPDSLVGFIPVCMFYLSLRWCWALSFPFRFHFYFVGRFFFRRILLSLLSALGDSLFFSLPFPT